MAKQTINNRGAGETGGTARTKINDNFTEVYNDIAAVETDIIAIDNTLADKLDSNVSITAGTKTKVTYDTKGLIISATDATTADIADSTDRRYCTDAQKVVIGNTSNTNTGDETASTIKTKLGITDLSGRNTGDDTAATIKTKLGITTLSGSNTGDQDLSNYVTHPNTATIGQLPLYSNQDGKVLGESTIYQLNDNIGIGKTLPTSDLDVEGSVSSTPIEIQTGTNLNNDHHFVWCSADMITLNLPAIDFCIGREYIIKGFSTCTNTVVAGANSDKIDGASTYTLTHAYECITIKNNSKEWCITNVYIP